MKKILKVFSMLMISILTLTLMIGAAVPKVTPDQSCKIFLDMILKNDNSRINDLEMSQVEYDMMRQEMNTAMMKAFDESDCYIAEDTKKILYDGMLLGMTKLEYETVLVSNTNTTATVEVKIKGFDMTRIESELVARAEKYYINNPNATEAQVLDYVFRQEAELFKLGYIKQVPTSIIITFNKDGNVWLPDDAGFLKIGQAIASY